MSLLNRLLKTFRRTEHFDDIAEELDFHRDAMQRSLESQGVDPVDARRQVAARFGSAAKLREETREAHIIPAIENWLRDIRLAWRSLAKQPALVATAVASLAAGIGATAAVFSVADAVFLKPLPLPRPENLYVLQSFRSGGATNGNPARLAEATSVDAVEAATGYYGETLVWRDGGSLAQAGVLRVFGDFWGTIGGAPAAGRYFTKDECSRMEPVAVVTEAFWRNRLASRPVPFQIRLGSVDLSVVGVAPESIQYFDAVEAILPPPAGVTYGREASFLDTLIRLRGPAAAAQAQIDVRVAQLAAQYPASDAAITMRVIPLQEFESRDVRAPLTILLTAVAGLLLIACGNVSGLLLGRAIERSREASIRRSLGAGSLAILRTYLSESLLLAFGGAAAGLVVAHNLVAILRSQIPSSVGSVSSIALDWRTAGFAAAATIVSGLISGWAPAWHASRAKQLAVRERTSTGSHSVVLRRCLAALQLALSVLLVVVSVLLARTFFASASAPTGISSNPALVVTIDFPWDTDSGKLRRFSTEALARLRELPGATGATFVDRLPFEGGTQTRPLTIRGAEANGGREGEMASLRGVNGDAFAVLGWPLLAGRVFREPEKKDDPREAVVSESFVRRYLAGQNPLGRQINFQGKSEQAVWFEIVGVARDYAESPSVRTRPQIFVSHRQVYWPLLRYVVTTSVEPGTLAKAARETLLAIDAEAPIEKVATLEESLTAPLDRPRIRLQMLGGFTALALGLSLLGLYGLMAAEVVRRRKELGIRLALGASPVELVQRMTRSGLVLASVATGLGLAGAAALLRVLSGLLEPMPDLDLVTAAAAVILALSASALASWIPARKAARVDPMTALRQD